MGCEMRPHFPLVMIRPACRSGALLAVLLLAPTSYPQTLFGQFHWGVAAGGQRTPTPIHAVASLQTVRTIWRGEDLTLVTGGSNAAAVRLDGVGAAGRFARVADGALGAGIHALVWDSTGRPAGPCLVRARRGSLPSNQRLTHVG